jgi:hypothetical protein
LAKTGLRVWIVLLGVGVFGVGGFGTGMAALLNPFRLAAGFAARCWLALACACCLAWVPNVSHVLSNINFNKAICSCALANSTILIVLLLFLYLAREKTNKE